MRRTVRDAAQSREKTSKEEWISVPQKWLDVVHSELIYIDKELKAYHKRLDSISKQITALRKELHHFNNTALICLFLLALLCDLTYCNYDFTGFYSKACQLRQSHAELLQSHNQHFRHFELVFLKKG